MSDPILREALAYFVVAAKSQDWHRSGIQRLNKAVTQAEAALTTSAPLDAIATSIIEGTIGLTPMSDPLRDALATLINDEADIRLPDGRLAIERERAVALIRYAVLSAPAPLDHGWHPGHDAEPPLEGAPHECDDPECYGPSDPRCGTHNCTCHCHRRSTP